MTAFSCIFVCILVHKARNLKCKGKGGNSYSFFCLQNVYLVQSHGYAVTFLLSAQHAQPFDHIIHRSAWCRVVRLSGNVELFLIWWYDSLSVFVLLHHNFRMGWGLVPVDMIWTSLALTRHILIFCVLISTILLVINVYWSVLVWF